MGSKTFTGYLLALGPIIMLTTWIFLWDALIPGAPEGAIGEAKWLADIEGAMENLALTKLVSLIGLGGMMAMVSDIACIQHKTLNKSKGRAVWSPRAQIDKTSYSKFVCNSVKSNKNISLILVPPCSFF